MKGFKSAEFHEKKNEDVSSDTLTYRGSWPEETEIEVSGRSSCLSRNLGLGLAALLAPAEVQTLPSDPQGQLNIFLIRYSDHFFTFLSSFFSINQYN